MQLLLSSHKQQIFCFIVGQRKHVILHNDGQQKLTINTGLVADAQIYMSVYKDRQICEDIGLVTDENIYLYIRIHQDFR